MPLFFNIVTCTPVLGPLVSDGHGKFVLGVLWKMRPTGIFTSNLSSFLRLGNSQVAGCQVSAVGWVDMTSTPFFFRNKWAKHWAACKEAQGDYIEKYSPELLYCSLAALADPTNIGIVRDTVSVATIVVVSAGVEIWLL